MPLPQLNVVSKRLIIRQGVNLGTAIAAAVVFDQEYVIPEKLGMGQYHYRSFAAEDGVSSPVNVWHTKDSIIVALVNTKTQTPTKEEAKT